MQNKGRAVGGKGREEERRGERERRKEKTGDWGCQRPSRVRKHPGHTETMTGPRPGLKKTQAASSLRIFIIIKNPKKPKNLINDT